MAMQQTFEFLGLGERRPEAPEPTALAAGAAAGAAAGTAAGARQSLRPEASAYGSGDPGPEASACGSPKASAYGSEDRAEVLRQLRVDAGCIDTEPDQDASQETFSTGSAAIDRLLPRGGLRSDAITEWVAEADGCGAAALSMVAAATHLNSSRRRGPLVVVSRGDNFYPPAAISLGISADRIIWVQPDRHADLVWAIDQALRCESVAAVWAPIRAKLDDRDARRFQLSAEAGHTPGLLIRTAAARGCPTFADVRFHVGNSNRDGLPQLGESERIMSVTLDRCRGGEIGRRVWVQIDDRARIDQVTLQQPEIGKNETAALRLASKLAHPTAASRGARKPGRRSA